jgi:hypothetical protein
MVLNSELSHIVVAAVVTRADLHHEGALRGSADELVQLRMSHLCRLLADTLCL